MARGEGGVRSYAEARPRAANGAKAVVVRGGRRTTRVSKHYAVMCSAICGVNVCLYPRANEEG